MFLGAEDCLEGAKSAYWDLANIWFGKEGENEANFLINK
jgi:hypothetical protein